jgi:putative Mg2+ transporter-C (MgtC) family protein
MIVLEDALTWTDVVIRLLAATGIGGMIGLNRELTRKPAGLRTHALVALGAALATVSAMRLGGPVDAAQHAEAVSRVIQGVVAGIGFIGGGVILHTEGRNVVGLTTAATIWVAAALGISCAVGQWRVAGAAVLIALAVLVVGRGVESALHRIKGDRDAGDDGNREGGTEN